MTDSSKPIGEIVWHDITVSGAPALRDFYRDVVGWEVAEHPMEAADGGKGYNDYVMQSPGGGNEPDAVAGVCHARGSNAGMPPAWLMYVRVADLGKSVERAVALGGEVIDGPRSMGPGQLAVVRDPAGAVIGLWVD